jgi:flagellar biogenesis protein FliO
MLLKKRFTKFLALFLFALLGTLSTLHADDTQTPVPTQVTPSADTQDNQAPISPEASTSSYESAFLKMMVTLGAFIFLILLSVWMIRRISSGRFRQGGSTRSFKIIDRRPLSAKTMLYVVEIEGKRVVLSESQLEVRTLTTVEEPTPLD